MSKAPKNQWPTGLCDCFSDCGTCCCGFWCTPCLFGQNAEKLGDGGCFSNCCIYFLLQACLFNLCTACYAGPKRSRLRHNHNLETSPCNDCCTHCWCGACAICQEARMIKTYGAVPQYQQSMMVMQAAPQQQFMSV